MTVWKNISVNQDFYRFFGHFTMKCENERFSCEKKKYIYLANNPIVRNISNRHNLNFQT